MSPLARAADGLEVLGWGCLLLVGGAAALGVVVAVVRAVVEWMNEFGSPR